MIDGEESQRAAARVRSTGIFRLLSNAIDP
jgi:hypothetical protein